MTASNIKSRLPANIARPTLLVDAGSGHAARTGAATGAKSLIDVFTASTDPAHLAPPSSVHSAPFRNAISKLVRHTLTSELFWVEDVGKSAIDYILSEVEPGLHVQMRIAGEFVVGDHSSVSASTFCFTA